jgi:hypothetical protein
MNYFWYSDKSLSCSTHFWMKKSEKTIGKIW